MTRRNKVLFSLTRKRIRPSYNKYNVFNAMTWRKNVRRGTLYQQVFTAKQETRGYHGEHLTETQFRNVFKSELNSVNPLQSAKEAASSAQQEIPWALQTFVALERRLDMAVFRAMLAASVRQAAQFIVRGNVKVNGVKIKQPGYVLRPGDMFSVEPERVLEALGRKKPSVKEAVKLVNNQISRFNKYLERCRADPKNMWRQRIKNLHRHKAYAAKQAKKQAARNASWNESVRKNMNDQINQVTPVSVLEAILRNDAYYHSHGQAPSDDKTKEFFSKCLSIYGLVGQPATKTAEATVVADSTKDTESAAVEPSEPVEVADATESAAESTESVQAAEPTAATASPEVTTIIEQYFPASDAKEASSPRNKSDVKKLLHDVVKIRQEQIRVEQTSKLRDANAALDANKASETYDPSWVERLPEALPLVDEAAAEQDINSVLPIRLPYGHGKVYGLAQPEKGYFTPWTPRQFLAPFAILPHHIEISFSTCHAIYLRDPVARPGHSELISPFPLDMHERAHMYYFARRRKYLS